MPGDESLANAWISRSGTKRYMVYTDGPRVGDRAYHPHHSSPPTRMATYR